MSETWVERVQRLGLEILARRLRPYGLTIEDYEALLEAQDHRCVGCEKKFGPSRVPCVDHDHATGEVRGLLCSPCNELIGFLHDDGGKLQRLANHLLTPIASRIFDKPRRHVNAPPTQETT